MNISTASRLPTERSENAPDVGPVAGLFRLLAQPARLRILQAIGPGAACVCHLEAALGLRQANISQQLMQLRDAGLVQASREGRNVYYRLADPRLLELIQAAAVLQGAPNQPAAPPPLAGCPCPLCAEAAGADPAQARQIGCDGQ